MKKAATGYVTLVEVLEITVPYEEFEAAVRAATERLEAEGVRELVSINFYGEQGSTEVGGRFDADLVWMDARPLDPKLQSSIASFTTTLNGVSGWARSSYAPM